MAADTTTRIVMRALVAHGVLEAPDHFRFNAPGEFLRHTFPGRSARRCCSLPGEMCWQLWSDFLECVRTGHEAIERSFGKTIFDRHAENAEARRGLRPPSPMPLMAAYDFGSFRRIADIGG